MQIVIPINDFLLQLFPEANEGMGELKSAMTEFYKKHYDEVKVDIKEGIAIISLQEKSTNNVYKNQLNKAVKLCEAGQFDEAVDNLIQIKKEFPNESEPYRLLGHINWELENPDAAINFLIDALRLDPENIAALTLIGNIFSVHFQDIGTALKYYNQILDIQSDPTVLYNVGMSLLKFDRIKEAQPYLSKAIQANPNFDYGQYGMALYHFNQGDKASAFEHAVKCIKLDPKKKEVRKNAKNLLITTAQDLHATFIDQYSIPEWLDKLNTEFGLRVKLQEDNSIPTPAKIEIDDVYDRDHHLIKYQSGASHIHHLITHEYLHAVLISEAKEEDNYHHFTSSQENRDKFLQHHKAHLNKLVASGVDAPVAQSFFMKLFDGLNSQLYNAPVDLFIEDLIFNKFQELRPTQMLSLFNLVGTGIKASTDKQIEKLSPKSIISASKILNIVHAKHFQDLYGIDMIEQFKATPLQLKQASQLFTEFNEYRYDKQPGEEYEIIINWGKDLNLEQLFNLVKVDVSNSQTPEELIQKIEDNPYEALKPSDEEDAKHLDFIKQHSTEEINTAVAFYMIGAMEFFEKKPKEETKAIAFEFATLGMGGISPEKKNYTVPALGKKQMTGYQALAYYYVSWAIAIPEMLSKLQLPFEKEFKLALQLKKQT